MSAYKIIKKFIFKIIMSKKMFAFSQKDFSCKPHKINNIGLLYLVAYITHPTFNIVELDEVQLLIVYKNVAY